MKRPDLFVPLSVRFATGKTGTRIAQDFGRDGLLTWVCFLAACKVNRPPGEIVYASEAEAWMLLGLSADPPKFKLDSLWSLTGRMKKTRKTRFGQLTKVECTVWTRWTDEQKKAQAAERSARYRGKSERDGNVTGAFVHSDANVRDRHLESDTEKELEIEHSDQNGSKATPALTDITQARPTSDIPGAQRILDQCDVFEDNTKSVIEALCIQLVSWPNAIALAEQELIAVDTRTIRRSKTALAVRLLQDAVAKVATREIA